MTDIFLSYAKDDSEFRDHLRNSFEAVGLSVWCDDGLKSGASYERLISQKIEQVKAVVVLWTENSVSSEWVYSEAEDGWRRNKLFQIREESLDTCKIPKPFGVRHVFQLTRITDLILDIASHSSLDLKILENQSAQVVVEQVSGLLEKSSDENVLLSIISQGKKASSKLEKLQRGILDQFGNEPTISDLERFIDSNPTHPTSEILKMLIPHALEIFDVTDSKDYYDYLGPEKYGEIIKEYKEYCNLIGIKGVSR